MEQSLSRHALDNLVKSGALASIAHGVYARPETRMTWQGLVYALQNILKTDLTVGGLSALDLQGFAHYLPLSNTNTIHLYGRDALPKWVNSVLPNTVFVWHGEKDFLRSGDSNSPRPLASFTESHVWREDLPPLLISSPERAYLEILMDVPESISFEHADQLMQGLTTLSPRRLSKLLKLCRNVKIRRLFYWLAERHAYPWFTKLPDPIEIDDLGLGSGNRVLAKGGRLNSKYRITIPEEMWQETTNMNDRSDF